MQRDAKNGEKLGFKPEETQVYESFGLNIEHAKRLKAWGIMDPHLSPLSRTDKADI
jgi:hypothetical protein